MANFVMGTVAQLEWKEITGGLGSMYAETPIGRFDINYWSMHAEEEFFTASFKGFYQLTDSVGNRKMTVDTAKEACYERLTQEIQNMFEETK